MVPSRSRAGACLFHSSTRARAGTLVSMGLSFARISTTRSRRLESSSAREAMRPRIFPLSRDGGRGWNRGLGEETVG